MAYLAVFQLLWGKFYPETNLFLLFNNGMSEKKKKRKNPAQFEGVKSTGKFYSLHSVPLQTTYTGQVCFAILTKCNGVEGGSVVLWHGGDRFLGSPSCFATHCDRDGTSY